MGEIAPIITALALLATALGGIYIGVQQARIRATADKTRDDIERVHIQVNSNLAQVKRELIVQNKRWDALVAGLGQHPDATRIFAELINIEQE